MVLIFFSYSGPSGIFGSVGKQNTTPVLMVPMKPRYIQMQDSRYTMMHRDTFHKNKLRSHLTDVTPV